MEKVKNPTVEELRRLIEQLAEQMNQEQLRLMYLQANRLYCKQKE